MDEIFAQLLPENQKLSLTFAKELLHKEKMTDYFSVILLYLPTTNSLNQFHQV